VVLHPSLPIFVNGKLHAVCLRATPTRHGSSTQIQLEQVAYLFMKHLRLNLFKSFILEVFLFGEYFKCDFKSKVFWDIDLTFLLGNEHKPWKLGWD